ncbi:MAG: hypothetical protein AAF386_06215, partial [Pseudomonadota bacterium]
MPHLFRTFLVFAICVACLVFVTGAQAQQQSALDQAQVALLNGRFEEAQQKAQILRSSHPLDAELIFARASFELGQLALAEGAARRAIALAGNSADARLMLARIQLRQNAPRRAMINLRRALDLSQTDGHRTNVRRLLQQTQSQLRFQFSLGFNIAPSTNVGKVTAATQYDPGITSLSGVTSFDPGVDHDSGVGLTGYVNTAYRLYAGERGRADLFAQFSARDYPGSEFDDFTQVYGLAYTLPSAANRSRTILSYRYTQFDRDDLVGLTSTTAARYHSNTFAISHLVPLDAPNLNMARHTFQFAAQRLNLRHVVSPSSYNQNRFDVTYTWISSPTTRWTFGAYVQDRQSNNTSIANRTVGVNVGARRMLGDAGWITDVSVGTSYAKWDSATAITLVPRWERDLRLSIGIENPNI